MFYPSDETAELEEEITTESEDEVVVDSDEESAEDVSDNEEEGGTYDFDGQEITADELREWKLAHDNRKHQQADYTKKGQAAAEQMKLATSQFDKYKSMSESLQESADALDLMLNDEENSIDWDELAEDDPGQALRLERKFKKKRLELSKAQEKAKKALKEADDAKVLEQSNELKSLLPEWFKDNGSTTEEHKKDADTIVEYLNDKGYQASYAEKIKTAKEWAILRDAAKYNALKKKKPEVKKMLKKAKSSKTQKSRPAEGVDWGSVMYNNTKR